MDKIPGILMYAAFGCCGALLLAPLIYRFGLVSLGPAFSLLSASLIGGVTVALASVLGSIIFRIKKLRGGPIMRSAMLVALVPVALVGVQIFMARGYPPIHDISTNWDDPPQFVEVLSLRAPTDNSLEPDEKVIAQQRESYPDLSGSIFIFETPEVTLEMAREVLARMGLTEVAYDPEAGRIEAVKRSLWFGFRDDFVVRVRPLGPDSNVDIRSASRVGVSDLGVNAARMSEFKERLINLSQNR
ncbi:MAG: DUF1499 domain-containing protein [Gammaproteobacteria bacterium AqS3]|nr:DUF1499 domain-containing protein [Gammaproteobacteria bacterium AqS3]